MLRRPVLHTYNVFEGHETTQQDEYLYPQHSFMNYAVALANRSRRRLTSPFLQPTTP